MPSGIRFFGHNYCEKALGGDVTVSSNDTKKWFAFDGLSSTKWFSSGEGTNGNQVTLERDFGVDRTIDSFYAWKTNIEDLEFEYWNGSSWTTVTTGNASISKSSDLQYIFAKLNTPVTTQRVRIKGDDTITPNEEKFVTLFYSFLEIGAFEYRPVVKPKFNLTQSDFKLERGKHFIIERGEVFNAEIEFKSYVNQNDINLSESLFERKAPFFIWICGGDVAQFRFSFRPNRFQDIYKVGIVKEARPELTKNYYNAGYNNKMKLIEVA